MASNAPRINLVPTHSDGAGDLQFSPDGSLMVTTGQDCRICIHETAQALAQPEVENVVTSYDCASPVTALHCFSREASTSKSGGVVVKALAACEDRMVSIYSVRDGESYLGVDVEETLARLSVPALSVTAASKTGACAFSGEDSSIHVVASKGAEMESINGCRPDVVGLAFDPSGEYIASASTSGQMRPNKIKKGQIRSNKG